jgi:predicted transcriptional regulator
MVARAEGEMIRSGRKAGLSKKKNLSDLIQDTLRLAVCSDLRRGILVSLEGGKKSLSDLRAELDVSSTTAIHALRELERGNLVVQNEDRDYMLTKIGIIIVLRLGGVISAIEAMKKHEEFWLTHDLSGIPPHLFEMIGDLSTSLLITDTPADLFKSHNTLLQILETAHEVRGIYPIFHLEYFEVIEELVKRKKIDVELIVTNEVLESIVGVLETEKAFKTFLDKPNFTLFAVDEDVNLALTLTDSILYLGFFSDSGLYDPGKALIGDTENALSWGRELYEYYCRRSKMVELWT